VVLAGAITLATHWRSGAPFGVTISGNDVIKASITPLAVLTGASPGIGYELAKQSIENGFDFVIATDQPEISPAPLASTLI
jgi:hypothetical protein